MKALGHRTKNVLYRTNVTLEVETEEEAVAEEAVLEEEEFWVKPYGTLW